MERWKDVELIDYGKDSCRRAEEIDEKLPDQSNPCPNDYGNHVLTGIIADIAKDMTVEEKLKSETAEFYADAVTGIFIVWLKQGPKKNPAVIKNRI